MKATRVGLVLTSVAMVLMATACAGINQASSFASTVPTSTASQSSTPVAGIYQGPAKATVDYMTAGVTVSSPGAVTPKVSWQAAYDTCTAGESVCLNGVAPTITLALATSTAAGTAQSDGSMTPLMKDTLVYVMTWTNEPCIPKGGPPVPSGAATPTPQPCTLLAFVDANTGAALYGAEGPKVGS